MGASPKNVNARSRSRTGARSHVSTGALGADADGGGTATSVAQATPELWASNPMAQVYRQQLNQEMQQQLATQESRLTQMMNEYRLQAEQAREQMVVQHCNELDNVMKAHDSERRVLHSEVCELRSECAQAVAGREAAAASDRPPVPSDSQVEELRQQLSAQVSELQEFRSAQLGQHEQDMGQLHSHLGRCEWELEQSQNEFLMLAKLYDKESREHQELQAKCEKLQLETTYWDLSPRHSEKEITVSIATPPPTDLSPEDACSTTVSNAEVARLQVENEALQDRLIREVAAKDQYLSELYASHEHVHRLRGSHQ